MNLLAQLGEFSVLWPRMLWLLALVPLLVLAYLRLGARQRRAQARLAELAVPATTGPVRSSLRRHVPPLLFILGLCALIAAVSRPQAVMMLPSLHKNIILAIDNSGSMRATDVEPNRLAAAQSAARAFVENQQRHSRIGIVSIAATASVVQSPTDNREDLLQAIERVQLQPGTAIGSGIYIALSTLLPDAGIDMERLLDGRPARSWRYWSEPPRVDPEKKPVPPGSNRSVAIVLLTDGENTHGPAPLDAAKMAADLGVRVYTVGIGSPEGITLGFSGWSMRVRLDEATLKKIAATTHGEYYAASSAPDLKRIYEQLSARMVVSQKRAAEVSAFFVGIGALLLAISAFFSLLWFNRVL
jgi:Ca-activated chloride channel family protein